MSLGAIVLLALGLAMDSTAVAAARGLAATHVRPRDVATVALAFGGAQALMPLLGWALGAQLGAVVASWDHWVAFGILAGLGGKMLWEARRDEDEVAAPGAHPFAPRLLFGLAVATSIDAFAAGVTLPMLSAPLVLSIATIGVVTAVLSGLGVVLGRRLGSAVGSRLEVMGGLALIGLGTRILVEHLVA